MKILLGTEYNGTAYHGWQSQPDGQTVQDTLENAIGQVANHTVTAFAAGRTDSGVHAKLMPVHFNTQTKRQVSAWVKAINYYLPSDIRVLWAKTVDESFHARHSCRRRYYQYIIYNRPMASALYNDTLGYCPHPLDTQLMQTAATRHLVGTHDFSAFRAASCQASNPIRQIHHIDITAHHQHIYLSFCGNGFLHHMVRNMVGALIDVGRQRRSPDWLADLRDSKNRQLCSPTAKANGLYFCGCDYATLPPSLTRQTQRPDSP